MLNGFTLSTSDIYHNLTLALILMFTSNGRIKLHFRNLFVGKKGSKILKVNERKKTFIQMNAYRLLKIYN